MTSASGALHDFHSRIEALEFALQEARKFPDGTPTAIRVEGADRRWRWFDCKFRPVVAEKLLPGASRIGR